MFAKLTCFLNCCFVGLVLLFTSTLLLIGCTNRITGKLPARDIQYDGMQANHIIRNPETLAKPQCCDIATPSDTESVLSLRYNNTQLFNQELATKFVSLGGTAAFAHTLAGIKNRYGMPLYSGSDIVAFLVLYTARDDITLTSAVNIAKIADANSVPLFSSKETIQALNLGIPFDFLRDLAQQENTNGSTYFDPTSIIRLYRYRKNVSAITLIVNSTCKISHCTQTSLLELISLQPDKSTKLVVEQIKALSELFPKRSQLADFVTLMRHRYPLSNTRILAQLRISSKYAATYSNYCNTPAFATYLSRKSIQLNDDRIVPLLQWMSNNRQCDDKQKLNKLTKVINDLQDLNANDAVIDVITNNLQVMDIKKMLSLKGANNRQLFSVFQAIRYLKSHWQGIDVFLPYLNIYSQPEYFADDVNNVIQNGFNFYYFFLVNRCYITAMNSHSCKNELIKYLSKGGTKRQIDGVTASLAKHNIVSSFGELLRYLNADGDAVLLEQSAHLKDYRNLPLLNLRALTYLAKNNIVIDAHFQNLATTKYHDGSNVFYAQNYIDAALANIPIHYVKKLAALQNKFFSPEDIISAYKANMPATYVHQFQMPDGSFAKVDSSTLVQYYILGFSVKDTVFVDTSKPNALIVFPTKDANSAFAINTYRNIIQKVKNAYDLRVIAASIEDQVYNALQTTPEIELLILNGHGNAYSLSLGDIDPQVGTIHDERYSIDVHDNELSVHLNRLHPDARIFLFSCSNADTTTRTNLATAIKRFSKSRKVFASKEKLATQEIIIKSIYPFDIRIIGKNRDKTFAI